MPPVFTLPSAVPENVQFSISPRLVPAMPPTLSPLPAGLISPSTFKFLTTPLSPTKRNSPWLEPAPLTVSPEIVCPFPSSVPLKMPMGAKSVPLKSMSHSSCQVFPAVNTSLSHRAAALRNCSAVCMASTSVSFRTFPSGVTSAHVCPGNASTKAAARVQTRFAIFQCLRLILSPPLPSCQRRLVDEFVKHHQKLRQKQHDHDNGNERAPPQRLS